jgi:BT4734-like, N-terminal domain
MNRVTTPTFGSALISRTHRIENASECETCTIDTFIAETISDQWKDPIDQIRAAQSKDEATTLKKELLGVFMLSGVFTGRAKDKFVAHSGCLCIDCDGVSDPVALRDKLARDRHTYFACLSPSGKGVKALVRIHPSAERHLASFVAAQRYFLDAYGVKLASPVMIPTPQSTLKRSCWSGMSLVATESLKRRRPPLSLTRRRPLQSLRRLPSRSRPFGRKIRSSRIL